MVWGGKKNFFFKIKNPTKALSPEGNYVCKRIVRAAKLETIQFGTSLTTIGNYAFSECDSLSKIILPTTVKTIGDYAFGYCDILYSVEFNGTEEPTECSEIAFSESNYMKMIKVTENYSKETFCGLIASTENPIEPPQPTTSSSDKNDESNDSFSLFSTILLSFILILFF